MTELKNRSATERPHVLIVSDDADLSAFLGEGLVYGGFWTSIVASGLQTLEVFRLRTFDLVLIDAALTGMPALEVVRRMRAGSEAPRKPIDIPILMIVDSIDPDVRQTARFAGVDEVLAPPLELENLVPGLYSLVDIWRAAHPGRLYADQASRLKAQE